MFQSLRYVSKVVTCFVNFVEIGSVAVIHSKASLCFFSGEFILQLEFHHGTCNLQGHAICSGRSLDKETELNKQTDPF